MLFYCKSTQHAAFDVFIKSRQLCLGTTITCRHVIGPFAVDWVLDTLVNVSRVTYAWLISPSLRSAWAVIQILNSFLWNTEVKQSIVFEWSHVRFHSKMNSKVLLNSEYLTRHTLGFHPTVQNVWISLQSIINSIACSREEWWGGVGGGEWGWGWVTLSFGPWFRVDNFTILHLNGVSFGTGNPFKKVWRSAVKGLHCYFLTMFMKTIRGLFLTGFANTPNLVYFTPKF